MATRHQNSLALTWHAAVVGLRDSWRLHRRWLLATVTLSLCQALMPAAQVLVIHRLLERLGQPTTIANLVALTLVVGTAFPLSEVAWHAAHRLGLRLTSHRQQQVLDAATRRRVSDLASARRADDLEAANGAAEALGAVPGQAIRWASTVVTALALVWSIATLSPWAAFLVGAALLPTVVAFTRLARIEMAGLPELVEATRRGRYLTDLVLAQRTGTELATLQSGPKVAALAAQSRARFVSVLDRLTAAGTRLELAAAGATSALLGAALWVMVSGQSSAPAAAASIAGVISALHAIRASAHSLGLLMAAAPKHALFLDVVAAAQPEQSEQPPEQPIEAPVVRHLRIDTLTHRYGSGDEPAVRGVSLDARQGEVVALVGVNGAGKTTTVNGLLGVITPQAGRVTIDGVDVSALREPERLARFGLLTQEFGRYELTVRQTLDLASLGPAATEDELWAALRAAKADRFVANLPYGLDTQLGEQWGGVGLSGGQWQRLSLARIHLRQAAIWVLDEPTAAIDAEAEREIFDELIEHRHDHMTILVSHRAWTLRGADRVYVLDGGQVVQVGTYEQLMASPGRFREIFTDQESSQPTRVADRDDSRQ